MSKTQTRVNKTQPISSRNSSKQSKSQPRVVSRATKKSKVNKKKPGKSSDQMETNLEIDFTGRYVLVSNQNFDKFLEQLGVNYLFRTYMDMVKSEYNISKEGDYFTLNTTYYFPYLSWWINNRTTHIRFKFGKQFIEERMDGSEVTSIVTQNNNIWIQKQHRKGEPEVTIVREFIGDDLYVTGAVNSAQFNSLYKRFGKDSQNLVTTTPLPSMKKAPDRTTKGALPVPTPGEIIDTPIDGSNDK